jgi:hypothetical protein
MNTEKTEQMNLVLPDQIAAKVNRWAVERDMTPSNLVASLVESIDDDNLRVLLNVECRFCGSLLSEEEALYAVPDPKDDDRWAARQEFHRTDCQWIAKRMQVQCGQFDR